MATFGEGIWLVEDKGSWAEDPDTLDVTDFTASGTDYWNIIYGLLTHGGSYKGDLEDLPGWTVIDISFEEGHDLVKVTGTFQGATFALTQAKGDELWEFFRNHTDLGDSTFYLVKDWGSSVYKKFPKADRSLVECIECRFGGAPKSHIENRVLHFDFTVRSAWST